MLEVILIMGQAYSIWTPVVIGRLKSPHRIKEEKSYDIEKSYHSVEDVKVKARNYTVLPQGQLIEVQIRLDILCLLEDFLGTMHLISKEEIVKEKIALTDFDSYIDRYEEIKYVVNNIDLTSHCELNGKNIKVAYFIDLIVIATSEQMIKLSTANEVEPINDSLQDVLTRLRQEVQQVEEEKAELRRKIFFYERDISSLKKGLKKAENKNSNLNKELKQYYYIVEQLKTGIKEKEMRLNRYENVYYNRDYTEHFAPLAEDDNETQKLGSRIKKMFMANN